MSKAVWSPQERQKAFMERWEDEALFGGSAGGGKSEALVIEATRQVQIPHYKGLILRKTYPQLTELIDKSLNYYPKAFPRARYNASEHTWHFPSGSKIIFGSMQHSSDKTNYQGKAYDFIGFDELTHFTYDEYIYLASRNRPNGPDTRCYIRATANPGGIGHAWVKERFITASKPMKTIWEDAEVIFPDGHKEMRKKSRVFVPSSVFDNKILMENDPNYVTRLASLPEAERNALLYGDWNSYSGQYFSEFRDDPSHYIDRHWTHVIEPFEIPSHWQVYRSFDWGYFRPFSCAWTVVDEDGIAYRILEYYGCGKTPNTGLQMTPQNVFAEIHRIECEHRWLKGKNIHGVADPAIWQCQTGASVEQTASKEGIYFSKGDNARIPGWLQCHYRLSFDENGVPMFYVFKNCKNFIRTVPALVFDDSKIEDIDTDGEDHIADEWRYFCQCRPISARKNHTVDTYRETPMAQFLDIDQKDILPQTRVVRTERLS